MRRGELETDRFPPGPTGMLSTVRQGALTADELDQIIIDRERDISRARADQMAAIRAHKALQTHTADGYRSMIDWLAARADVSHRTARAICWTATRLDDAPDVERTLADGEISFDRAEQLARLPKEKRENHEWFDIGQLRRQVAHHRRLSRKRERATSSPYLYIHTTLDETRYDLWGEFGGLDGAVVEKALNQRADELDGSEQFGISHRRALALVAICQDSLYQTHHSDSSPTSEVSITIDARTAVETTGESGVAVLTGPRIGAQALDAILCDAIVEVVGISEEGTPLNMGRRSRTVPPTLRRHILTRDMGCTVEGCSSRYRLEVHHSQPWSRGGRTDAESLFSLLVSPSDRRPP